MKLIPDTPENRALFYLSGGFCVHCGGKRQAHFYLHCIDCASDCKGSHGATWNFTSAEIQPESE